MVMFYEKMLLTRFILLFSSQVQLLYEVNPIGRLWPTAGPTWRVSNVQILDFSGTSPRGKLYRGAMMAYCLLTTCTFLYLDLRKAKHRGVAKVLSDGWTIFELLFFTNIIVFIYYFLVYKIHCDAVVTHIGLLVAAPDTNYLDMTKILEAYRTMSNVLAYASFLSLVKVFKYLRLNDNTYVLNK